MSKKYKLTSEIKKIKHARTRNIINLYRIRALKDFDDVKAGDLGGFIEKEANLSHDGNCWVYDKACVYGYARVYDNVYGYAHVSGGACVFADAHIHDHAHVSYDATIFNYARVYGRAIVAGSARIHSYAEVYNYALINGRAKIHGKVYGGALVGGCAEIYGSVFGNAKVLFYTKVWGRAYGNAKLTKKSKVREVPINYEVYESDNLVKIVDETE
ncbi:hypothetical protein [Bartonella massiliensis]|uniref:hypothetical protein n=1 Tax=Bartonella massiliensis TaxID=929795 RepID=UPI00115882D7|nr:hypothetical protein [Bartonella massiliensis]